MLNREYALNLIKVNVKNENLIKHMLAVEAIMKKCAEHLQEDVDKWGLLGLVHDLDYEKTKDKPEKHASTSAEMLEGKVDEELLRAIKSHNFEHTRVMPETKMENCLIAADAISGLIVATALMMPSKKLEEVKVKSIKKKFKQKDFARNCSRERMLYCERAGMEKEKFFELALEALQRIAEDLGL